MAQEKHYAIPDSSFLWKTDDTCQTIGNNSQIPAWEEFTIYWKVT